VEPRSTVPACIDTEPSSLSDSSTTLSRDETSTALPPPMLTLPAARSYFQFIAVATTDAGSSSTRDLAALVALGTLTLLAHTWML
jgi:hypothetical protein